MSSMNKWEDNVRRVVPYVPGEQPKESGVIKLNTNENPYPPSPMVEAALRDFDTAKLRLYPDTEAKVLVKELSAHYNVPEDQIFVGVGSDDVLSMAFMTSSISDFMSCSLMYAAIHSTSLRSSSVKTSPILVLLLLFLP